MGFQQCLRWAVLDSRGVFSTPRTAPLRGRAQGPPAHGRGRPRPSKAGARTSARRLTKGIVAPRLCPSSRGESSDEKCDAPGLCTEQAQWPLPRCSPPSVWWSTFRLSLENESRKHCHPAGCPLALAQRHTGSPTGRIRVPCPLLPGNFHPEWRRWRWTYAVNGVRRPGHFLALPGQASGESSCLPPLGRLQLPGA